MDKRGSILSEMSSFDIAAIISELKMKLTDAWISNIYQLDELFTMKFRTKEGAVELVIEPQKRIHLTKYNRPKPKIPSKFCMTLRKYLRNQRVLAIEQYQFDRVIVIIVGRKTPEDEEIIQNKLVIEFFERGNLLLLDSEGKVIVALSYRTMRDRRIIPNRDFEFAPSRGKNIRTLMISDLKSIFESGDQTLIRSLIANLNIGPLYAEEICFRANLDKKMLISKISDEQINEIYRIIENMLQSLKGDGLDPKIYRDESDSKLAPIELLQFSTFNKQNFKTFNEAADEFFSSKEEIKTKVEELKEVRTELTKTEKILRDQKKAMVQLEQDSIRYKILGELLYQHFQEIEELLLNIKKARENGRSWEEIKEILKDAKEKKIAPAQYIKNINYKNATLVLKIADEEFPIDFRKTVADNANNFYTKAKKAAAKLKGAKRAYQKMLEQKDKVELETEIISQKEEKLREKRKKHWYEKFHWFISSDDFLVIGGRDLNTNELIVKRYMDKNDIFLHATYRGASVVVIKTENNEITEQTLLEAAQFEVTFSSAWKAQHGQADAYWVHAPQVSQTPPSGEYLQKGSFIITGKRNHFKNVPLRIRVGVKFDEKFAIIMSGPPTAIQKQTIMSVEVKFGDKSNAYLAKIIKDRFLKSCSDDIQRKKIKNLAIDEIQRSLPGGRGELSD